jgi:hypothetical protein
MIAFMGLSLAAGHAARLAADMGGAAGELKMPAVLTRLTPET